MSAGSATGAWSVWTGTAFTAVERLQGTRWSRVPLPAALTAYARSAVAFGGDSATDFWLFNSRSATHVLRFAGARWTLQRIPSWVLQRQSGGGGPSVSAAVFGPGQRLGLRPRGRRLRRPLRRPRVGEGATAGRARRGERGQRRRHLGPARKRGLELERRERGPRARSRGRPGTRPRASTTSAPPGRGAPGCGVTSSSRAARPKSTSCTGTAPSWRRAGAGTPADLIDSVVPDGSGGLWATGADVNPGGFNLFYHLAGGRWKRGEPAERHLGPAARVPDLDPGHALGLGHRHRPHRQGQLRRDHQVRALSQTRTSHKRPIERTLDDSRSEHLL